MAKYGENRPVSGHIDVFQTGPNISAILDSVLTEKCRKHRPDELFENGGEYSMKRILCTILAAVMLLGLLPAQALAVEAIPLPETELSEELTESGVFYLASQAASLSENENGWYLLRVARGGSTLEAATLRLELVDITASYGEDYKVALSDSGLTGSQVGNAGSNRSLMDQIMEEGVQEDLQQDLALAGMSDEQIEAALQEQTDGFGAVMSQELSAYASEHPDRYVSEASDADREALADTLPGSDGEAKAEDANTQTEPAAEAVMREHPDTVSLDGDDAQDSASASSLSAAYEAQTGRKDDWKALSRDGTSILDASSLMMDYSMDAANAITEGLNSAYLDIPFDQGQTERIVMIRTEDNSKGQGDRLFMARLTAQSENASVDVENGRCMCTIADDEDWEAPVVSFAGSAFDAKNGFVDVVIRREGVLTPVSSVHLTTADGSAVNGRDYSQVDADVSFPFGVTERTIHIPVRSDWLNDRAEFSLTLSDAKNCQLGKEVTASGVIQADSESFVMPASQPEEDAELMVYSGGVRYGDAIDLSKWTETKVYYGTGSVWMEGSKCKIKADSNGLNDDRAWTYAEWNLRRDIKRDGNIKALTGYAASGIEYNGIAVKSSRNDDGLPTSRVVLWSAPNWYNDNYRDSTGNLTLGSDSGSWSSTENRIYWNAGTDRQKQGVSDVRIWNSKADGFWRKQNTLTVEEIRPILRPFIVTAEIANPEALRYVDNQGNLVDYKAHDSAKSAGELVIGGANTGENTVVKYVGDYIEVTCSGEYSYIQKIQLTNSSGNSYAVTPTYPVGNKTAKFALDTSALRYLHNRDLITFSKNPDGDGYVGELKLEVVMGKIPTGVTLNNNDKRGHVQLGFDLHNGNDKGTKKSGDDRNYSKVYRGDYVRFTEALDNSYKDSFTASTIRVKRDRQTDSGEAGYTNDAYETFDRGQTAWQVTLFNNYSALTAWPSFDDIDNHVVVRVSDKDKALFDTSGGIFTAKTLPGQSGYTDYEVVPQASFAAHAFYPLTATPKDADSVAIWTPGNSKDSYSQNTFYHEAAAEKGSNVIVLTCKKADSTPYAVTGEAYYAALDLRTGVEGETWMPADGLTVMLTPAAYAISGSDGSLTTIPFKGLAGCRVVMRTEALGNVNYKYATLTQGRVRPVGTGDASVRSYLVPLGTFVVPVVNPNVTSINAASLTDNQGVAIKTAAVYADAIEAQKHRYTFTATAVHDGVQYTDTDGKLRTEHVKSVEFLAFDGNDNTQRGLLPGTVKVTDNGNGSKTYSLTLGLDMSEENLNIYRPGDKIYVRLTTDRVKGNGKSVDEKGTERDNATLQETVYAPVYTGYDLVSAASYTPPELNINVAEGSMDSIFEKLPIFGSLNSTLKLSKLAVSEQALPNGGISLCIGYRLNTDKDVEVKEFDEEFKGIGDAAKKMMEWGKLVKSPPPMVVGVGNAGVNPFVGIYLDFGISDKEAQKGDLVFIGGGLYVGCMGFFKVVLYFPVGPVPVYFGVEGDLTGYVNLGFQIPDNAKTLADVAESGVDDMMDFDFKFKAQARMCFYVGVGLAGTLGVRGGMNFNMWYMYYPSVKNINPKYHEHGFTIDLSLQVWVDAFWFSIPIPALNLAHESFGYAKDIENGGPSAAALASAEDTGPVMRQAVQPTGWMPPEEASLQSTLEESLVTTMIGDNYPYADPQFLDTGNELILVFLTTEALFGTAEKGRGDETTLAYSIYPYQQANAEWSKPKRLGNTDTMRTGDFQPNVILFEDETGADILVSWVSRLNVRWAEDPDHPTTQERLAYLSQMEIYAASCKVEGESLNMLDCQRVTDDALFNSQPQAIWELIGGVSKTMLFYEASEPGEKNIAKNDPMYTDFPNEESQQLLANVSTTQNGSFQMKMEHDQDDKLWRGSSQFGSFVVTPVGGQNHPVITDFVAQEYYYYPKAASEEEQTIQSLVLFAYTVDGDGNLSTAYDEELYLQLYDAEKDRFFNPIQLTNNESIAVNRPQFTELRGAFLYLLWYEGADTTKEEYSHWKKNGRMQMLDVRELFYHGLELDMKNGTCKLKDTVSLDELKSSNPEEYAKLSDKDSLSASYEYSLPVQTVNMPLSDEFAEGPSLASFMPYMDNQNNLYIIWLQSMMHEIKQPDGTVQEVQTNDIYASAKVRDDGVSKASNLWSMPVRLTNDEKFYDETTLVNLFSQNKLIVAANRYEFALAPDGKTEAKPVESADFVVVEFDKAGSVEAVDISYDSDMPVPGEEVGVTVTIQNTGLLTAEGGSYTISDMPGGQKGSFTKTGTVGKLLPGETEEVRFTYTMPEDLSGLDSIGFAAETKETGYDTSLETQFLVEDAIQVGWRATLGDVQTEERSDGFYVTYELINTGNTVLPAGAVRVVAGDNSDMGKVWAEQTPDQALQPGDVAVYTVKLDKVPDDFSTGIQRGFLMIRDAEGRDLDNVGSSRDLILTLDMPYHIVVNGDAALQEKGITMKVGDTLALSGTYEGKSLYPDGSVLFASQDSSVAASLDGTLYAMGSGETTLVAKVGDYGGTMRIPVTVTGSDTPTPPSGGGGGGGSAAANPVNLPAAIDNGSVTASVNSARAGDRVTLTLTPDEGYQVSGITVADAKGSVIPVTKNEDGTYSFTMPGSAVTVTPSFAKAEELPTDGACPRDSTCPISGFQDAEPAAWYHDGIHWALDEGIMNGIGNDRFAPNGSTTRAMIVTMLWRMEGEKDGKASPFTDVTAGSWYEKAVNWAAETGVVNGTSETAFSPDDPVTREQLAAMLYRYAQYKGQDVSVGEDTNILSYDDALSISAWAIPAMQWACGTGIIQGVTDSALSPRTDASRAQVATMLMRFAGAIAT